MFNCINQHGELVKKSKLDYPYSYDPFLIYRKLPNSECNTTLYSDRLINRMDYETWDALRLKHKLPVGHSFDNCCPLRIESFLQEALDQPTLVLGYITEMANVSNGYPVWMFAFKI